MPKLDEDEPTFGVHGFRNLPPAFNLLRRVQAGCVLIALGLGRHLGSFGNDQASRGALAVVGRSQCAGHETRTRAVTSQGRHDNAIGERQLTQNVRFEKRLFGHVGSVFHR